MNEKIKQLAEQAGVFYSYQDQVWELTNGDLEKFAELIVRECADICRDDGRWFQEQDDKVEAGVAYALCYKIKEHFGVEE